MRPQNTISRSLTALYCVLFIGAIVWVALSYYTRLEGNTPLNRTKEKLWIYKMILDRVDDPNLLASFDSTRAILKHGYARRLYFPGPSEEEQELETDGWGNRFLFRKEDDGRQVVIKVISFGPNGISENGSGDDIIVERVVLRPVQ